MAFIIKDRVKENTTSTGTGAVSLGGAAATFDTFQSYMTNGDTTYYAIVHTSSGTDEWEVGLGTWNTGNTLTRTTVLAGSSGTSAVNFSSGTKDVFMTYPASKAAVAGEDVTFADITVTGTVDGRDVAADGTKLDGIDTSADVTDATTVAAAGALMKSGGTMTGNLILNADPTAALGAATKEYVDTIASAGIHYHDPVRVESPSALTVTYNNGTNGVGATLTNAGTQEAITIDGVALSLNDRVLIYKQTDQTQNGVYKVTTVGSGSTNWVLTRTTDTDSYGASDPDSFGKGDAFFVKEGNTGAGELYVMTTAGTITFGTTNIVFSQVAETAVYSAGTGLTLTGTTFSIGQSVGTTDNVTFNQVTAAIIGDVTGDLTGDVTGNADTATALATARTIQLSGDVTGSASFDGSANINITAAVQDDSHAHVISNVDGLQDALDDKADDTTTITAGNGLTGGGDLSANRTLNVGAGSGITVSADAVAHADTSTQASVNNSGNNFIQDVTLDGFGHVTGLTSGSVSVGDATITISAGGGLQTGGDFTTNQSTDETITLAHADTSSQTSVNNSNGSVIQDVTLDTYGHVTGLTSTNLDGRYVARTGSTMSGTLTMGSNPNNPGEIRVNDSSSTAYTVAWKGTGTRGYAFEGSSSSGDYNTTFSNAGTGAHNVSVSGDITSGGNAVFHDGYHPNADKWTTARTLSLSNDASGSVSWDGSANATLSVTLAADSVAANEIAANAVGASELNVSGNGSTSQFLRSDGDGTFSWATPTDTNTTYSAGSGLSLSGTSFSHSDTSTQASVNNTGRTYIQDITLDSFGHVTSINSATETVVNTDTNTTSLPIENSAGTTQFTATDTTGLQFVGSGATSVAFDSTNKRVTISSTDTNTDTNTTYSAGSGLSLSGTTFSHSDTSSASNVNNSGNTFIQDITIDTYGHITAISSGTAQFSSSVPSGSVMIFAQTSAPTGWTKSTTHNNKALRVVSGTASSGGNQAFTTAFASRTTSSTTAGGSISNTTAGGSVGSTTLSTSQMPSHNHQAATYTTVVGWSGNSPGRVFSNNLNYSGGGSVNTGSTGGSGSHNHSFSGSSHNHTFTGSSHSHTLDMRVQYVDVILASKD
jgi:trimeric autotransporter adhesin